MNNKKLTEKIFNKIEKEEKPFWNENTPTIIEKAISLAFAEKDAQKDLFIKKLKEELIGGDIVVDKLNKEVFEDG